MRGEILQLWVSPTQQKKGYGYKLLQEAIKSCQKSAILTIFLEVRSDNVPAQQLYKKAKFKQVGIRPNYYTVDTWKFDAIIMQKTL